MASDLSSDDFELIDSLEVAKHIAAEKPLNIPKIQSWLAPTDFTASSSEFHRHLSSRAPETGEWIRETSQFRLWDSSENHGSIWIKAVPGAGKSVVAASMIHSLAQSKSTPVLHFFFRQIIETNRTARSLLRDWLCQLLPHSEILQVSLWELVEEKRDLENVSTNQLWKYLFAGLRHVEKAYCVVDALDEMNIDEDFLARLDTLGSFRPANVKILMTSRPKQYLQRTLKDPQVIHVSLEEELVNRDISLFVRQRTAGFSRHGVDSETQKFITETVCKRSDGLFLYARLMLDQIAKTIEANEDGQDSVREAVAKLPVGLEEMYNQILFDHMTITQVHQSVQVLILQLVTHSARPLRLIEIAKALETSPHISKSGRDSKEVVRSACGPLLEIMEDEVVQILHHSFTEFLLDGSRKDRPTTNGPQCPVIQPAVAHQNISIACLAILGGEALSAYPKEDDLDNSENVWGHSSDRDHRVNFREIFMQHPLLEYAAKNWTYHAKRCTVDEDSFFNNLEQFCDPSSSHFRAWLDLMSKELISSVARQNSTRLHVAAGFGLSNWAQYLIENGADLDALDSSKNTPLFWAAKGGHTRIVELMLKAGAKLDIDGYDGLKPLHAAASRNHAEVVKLLLAAGVSPTTKKTRDVGRMCGNAPSSVGQHPLQYASQSGHVETVLEMFSYAKKEDLENALCRAAAGGHSQLVYALLERGVSPDSTSIVQDFGINHRPGPESALMLAASALEPDCVNILLKRGASVKQEVAPSPVRQSRRPNMAPIYFAGSSSPKRRTPLHSLTQSNRSRRRSTEDSAAQTTAANMKSIIDMLLEAGADLEAKDDAGNTPLLLTIGHHWTESTTMDLLLAAGADPCATNSNGETLLHRACKSLSNTNAATLLLAHNALPGCKQSSDGSTPIHCAIENIHSPVDHLKLLVKNGADVNAQNSKGNTPLHNACEGHSIAKDRILAALLGLGADVNVQNDLGQTCMHLFRATSSFGASKDKELELPKSIIGAGANLEIQDRDGKTVLLSAVIQNNRSLLQVLLNHPKPPSLGARTFLKGQTALHLACHTKDSMELIKLLVSNGADPGMTDNDGNTLLHEVAKQYQGSEEEVKLVEYLVGIGISPNSRNCKRQTAAHIMRPPYVEDNTSRSTTTRETFVSTILRLNSTLDVNAPDIDGYTQLHFAASTSEAETFSLLQRGADPNAKSLGLRTPLHCAARGRQSSIIAMLLRFGAVNGRDIEINAADSEGRTALHDACRSGSPESVSILIEAGSDINVEDKMRLTPLMVCSESLEEDNIWRVMIDAERKRTPSSSLSIHDPFRLVPSIDRRHFGGGKSENGTFRISAVAQLLIKDAADVDGALLSALSHKNTELVMILRGQKMGGETQKTGYVERTLTSQASDIKGVLDSYNGHGPNESSISFVEDMDETTMNALVARGIDFTKAEQAGDDGTAIAKIARLGRTELMSKIITKAKLLDDTTFAQSIAEIVHCGFSRVRPVLQVACDRPTWNMDMVRLLVSEGLVDVNAHQVTKKADKPGQPEYITAGSTALHVLAKGDFWWQVDAIEYLVNQGAHLDALDEDGQTPLDIASSYKRYCSETRKGFFKPQCCEMFLKLGSNPDRMGSDGLTPLNRAGSDGDVIKVLLKHGAGVNVGKKGVLMSAVESGNVGILKIYLENGADCNIPDTSTDSSYRGNLWQYPANRYPLAVAAFPPTHGPWSTSESIEMVTLFLQHGAKVDLPANDEETLLHFIFQRARSSILRCFVERPDLDFNIRDSKGRTVFMAACASTIESEESTGGIYRKPEEKARLKAEYIHAYMLLADSERYGSKIDYLATDTEGKHLIFYLLAKWNDKVAERFLPIPGVRRLIGQKNNAGYSPLHVVLQWNRGSLFTKFVEDGDVDLRDPDPNGDTALHHLFRSSLTEADLSLATKALSLGVDINARNNLGETPFLANVAAAWGPHQVRFLTEHGGDFQAATNDGTTALHMVARRETQTGLLPRNSMGELDNNRRAFKALVKLGLDPLQEDGGGRTALDIAASVGNDGILALYQRNKDVEYKAADTGRTDFAAMFRNNVLKKK